MYIVILLYYTTFKQMTNPRSFELKNSALDINSFSNVIPYSITKYLIWISNLSSSGSNRSGC